jgi:hypothetical protein
MGTWIEIRCEKRSEESSFVDGISRCWSHDNQGPMGEASDNRESLLEVMRHLEAVARKHGWKKRAEGWICPYCSNIKTTKD